MTENTIVRTASAEDFLFILHCQLDMAWETEKIRLKKEVTSIGVQVALSDNSRGFYVIAEVAGHAAGCLMITQEWSDWRNAWIWWIQSVYVIPQHRRAGVFSDMYRYIRKLVEDDPEIAGIRLYVDNTNESAAKVYTALGMNGDHYTTFEWMK